MCSNHFELVLNKIVLNYLINKNKRWNIMFFFYNEVLGITGWLENICEFSSMSIFFISTDLDTFIDALVIAENNIKKN